MSQPPVTPPPPVPDTQTRLIDAAARLFHEQGFNGTGISTILREAGVNSGSLYHFFPSKEALLVAVLERYTHLLRPIVMAPVEAATPDPIERVFALMAQYRGWLSPIGFAQGCPIGNLALEVGDSSPQARELIRKNFEGWYGVVRSWLEDAGSRLPAATDRGQLAVFVLTVLEGGIMQARAAQSPKPFDDSVSQLRIHFDLLMEQARA
jgi:TetR/AcrR family transcriptional regulator, transcriptional repressor for nem operon